MPVFKARPAVKFKLGDKVMISPNSDDYLLVDKAIRDNVLEVTAFHYYRKGYQYSLVCKYPFSPYWHWKYAAVWESSLCKV